MITFTSDLDLINYLKNQGFDCSHIEDSQDLEVFLKKNESKIQGYCQDLEYLTNGAPKYVIDNVEDKASVKKYEAIFSVAAFDKNQKLVQTPFLVIPFKTSIKYENETIGAFEQKVWNLFFKIQDNWISTIEKNKDIVSISTPSMKVLSKENKGFKVLTIEQFNEQKEKYTNHIFHYGTKKFHQSKSVSLSEIEKPTRFESFTHIIIKERV